jgi:hypothetical protein
MDEGFDEAFNAMKLAWLPWVGRGYRDADTKVVVLGESIYDYSDGDETVRSRILSKHSLRRRQMAHGILASVKSRYLSNFERAVFLKKKPTSGQREFLWSQVVYHNLVPRLLKSRQDRPTLDDYTDGWKVFLELAEMVKAQRCIVYGVETLKVDSLLLLLKSADPHHQVIRKHWLSAVGGNRPLALSFVLAGGQIDLLFMRHPSSFFSWDKWGKVLTETEMMPVVPTMDKVLSP